MWGLLIKRFFCFHSLHKIKGKKSYFYQIHMLKLDLFFIKYEFKKYFVANTLK